MSRATSRPVTPVPDRPRYTRAMSGCVARGLWGSHQACGEADEEHLTDRRGHPGGVDGSLCRMPPNGIEVRGLRVLRTYEDRDPSWLRTIVETLLVGSPPISAWAVLTVLAGPGDAVATRRFSRDREAEAARTRFVELVTEMTDDDYATTNWQSMLDGV
jgi:hypothetical protein